MVTAEEAEAISALTLITGAATTSETSRQAQTSSPLRPQSMKRAQSTPHALSSNDQPTTSSARLIEPPRRANTAPAPVAAGISGETSTAAEDAIRVREHFIYELWGTFGSLRRRKRVFAVIGTVQHTAEIIACIVILSLHSSRANSFGSNGAECQPVPLYSYICLYLARRVVQFPLNLVVLFSPHANAAQRRPLSNGFAERERSRRVGSIVIERRVDRARSLIAWLGALLFIYGNVALWTRIECAQQSTPIYWTSFVTIILYLCSSGSFFLLLLIVFALLPLLIIILRILRMANLIPEIRPETKKITLVEVQAATKLVHYIPAEEEEVRIVPPGNSDHVELSVLPGHSASSLHDIERMPVRQDTLHLPLSSSSDNAEAAEIPLPTTPTDEIITDIPPQASVSKPAADISPRPATEDTALVHGRMRGFIASLILHLGRRRRSLGRKSKQGDVEAGSGATRRLRYPLHPLSSNRATCAICLCDFESPLDQTPESSGSDAEPEPLRLLPCQHVFHTECVDEWLTKTSGRCPTCQRPILGEPADGKKVSRGRGGQAR